MAAGFLLQEQHVVENLTLEWKRQFLHMLLDGLFEFHGFPFSGSETIPLFI